MNLSPALLAIALATGQAVEPRYAQVAEPQPLVAAWPFATRPPVYPAPVLQPSMAPANVVYPAGAPVYSPQPAMVTGNVVYPAQVPSPQPALVPADFVYQTTDPDAVVGTSENVNVVDGDSVFQEQGPGPRLYGSAEYLLWFIRGSNYPRLVTTGPPINQTGITLFGGGTVTNGPLSGMRFRLGYWLDDSQTSGVEASFFFLVPRSTHFLAGSDPSGNPILVRPITNSNGQPSAEIVTFPGAASGAAAVGATSGLLGAELNYRTNLWNESSWRLDGLAGFRYLNLYENLNIVQQATVLSPVMGFPAGTALVGGDSFNTQNNFYGGQVGFNWQYNQERWVVNLRTMLGLGGTSQNLQIWGKEAVAQPNGGAATFPGDLLAQRTNIGAFNRSHLSFVPEVGANLGYRLTENLKLIVGYNFLLWTNVIRPGDQIDTVVNPANAPPPFNRSTTLLPVSAPFRPLPLFNQTSFWAQGINLGVQFTY